MKSLITGIGGFVGSYLCEHLLSGNHEVFGIERTQKAKVRGSRVFRCDILDRDKVFGVFKSAKPDFVFHLAAMSSVPESYKNPELTRRINVEGTRNVLDAAVEYSPSCVFLSISTAHVYGIPKKIPISESHPLNPVSPYAVARVEQENLVMDYFRRKRVRAMISRSFNHTGPGQPEGFVCSDFARQIALIEKGADPVMRVGDLSSRRDFSDVRDVVSAYLLAVEKCTPGEIYNVCSGSAYSGRDILGIMFRRTGSKIRIAENAAQRRGDVPVLVGDNSKFVKATGWQPKIKFEQTVSDVLDYWRGRV